MKIKHTAMQRIIRKTTATVEFADEKGDIQTGEIQVHYYSPTMADLQNSQRAMEASNGDIGWVTRELAPRIHALPDILGDDDKPIEITVANLESLPIKNLNAIQEAIEKDLHPKSDATA